MSSDVLLAPPGAGLELPLSAGRFFDARDEAEHRAASSVKENKDWSYARWTEEVTRVLIAVENAIWPDLIIVGGGISRKADKWVPLLKNRTPVVAAALQNSAGIVGAAMAAVDAGH